MQLKGSQRGGALQLAKHLINGEENEKVTIHEINGFIDQSVTGALNEIYAISKGTQSTKFMYSLSLNPPANENVPVEAFEDAIKEVAKKLSLENQPHVIVFHEKKGRRHAHCVWSRINIDKMTAIQMSNDHPKLKTVSKSLYLQHGWKMPKGMRDYQAKSPLNFTHAEMQQALRTGQKASHIKQALQECWTVSHDKQSFEKELKESGYWLAKGDKRNIVLVVDVYGALHPLRRKLGLKQTEIIKRLGKAGRLPSIKDTKLEIAKLLTNSFKRNFKILQAEHRAELKELVLQKKAFLKEQNEMRVRQKKFHNKRWSMEEKQRQARVRSGVKGTWDKFSRRYRKIQKRNEHDTLRCYERDQKQRDDMIYTQLQERKVFQEKVEYLKDKHRQETKILIRDLYEMQRKTLSRDTSKTLPVASPTEHIGNDINPDIEM